MAKVLKVDGALGDAWIEKDLGSTQPEVWVTFRAYLDSDSLSNWNLGGAPFFITVLESDDTTIDDLVAVAFGQWSTAWGSSGGTTTAGSWIDYEFHHVTGGASELYVGGSLVAGGTDGSTGDIQFVRVGQFQTVPVDPSLAYFDAIKVGSTRGADDLFADDFSSGDLSFWTTTSGDVSVIDDPFTPPAPTSIVGRVQIAFDDPTLEPDPTWTDIDSTDNLVASYSIDRGRVKETDTTDGGRATVQINDTDGILDPTNPFGPYYGKIEPLLQVRLRRWNPITEDYETRFRGFIDNYGYDFDRAQGVNRLTIDLVDIFAILNTIEMQADGTFGDVPPAGSEGDVFFDNANMDDRIIQTLTNALIDPAFYVVFSGNVSLQEAVYSAGETPLAVIQDAVDAEFPGAANAYPDRFGRLAVHGRKARFDPEDVISSGGPIPNDVWDWHHWHVGDFAAVQLAASTTAQIREFSFERGLADVVNQASAMPKGIADADRAGQTVSDPTSIGKYGIRSWSIENLLTEMNLDDSSDALTETYRFAQWRVDTHKDPRNRITKLTVKSVDPDRLGAAATWNFLSKVDISDFVGVAIASPGGGGFNDEDYVVEGIHETNEPLNPLFDLVTISLDVSPRDYNTDPEGRFPTS